jgi:hypothetical protein
MKEIQNLAIDLLKADNMHDQLHALKAIREYYAANKKNMDIAALRTPCVKRTHINFKWRDLNWDDQSWGWNSVWADEGVTPQQAVEHMLYTTGDDRNKQWGRNRKDVEYKDVEIVSYKEYDDMVRATYMD